MPWNVHSQAPGVYDFSGGNDIEAFFRAVHAEGLLLNVRPGPYICGEHDFGGLPAYLLATQGITSADDLRTNNAAYMAAVRTWWGALLPRLAPYTIANGGPIAMVQIENEYGSYGNVKGNPADREYVLALRDLALEHMPGTQLFTTDGNSAGYIEGGAVPGVIFATGDGSGPPWAADAYNPPGWRAHLNSELYPGWLTHWGEAMANTSAGSTVGAISAIMAGGDSFNLYMVFGGSNFGWNGGANGGGATDYSPVITSYDYDAPISEGFGHGYGPDGDKYDAIRRIIGYWSPSPAPPPEPPAPAVTPYGPLRLDATARFFADVNLPLLAPSPVPGFAKPPTMESLRAPYGYILYSVSLPQLQAVSYQLTISGVADYATVFIGGVRQGLVWRPSPSPIQLDASLVKPGALLSILVESMGHINYGRGWWDPKGINGDVLINAAPIPGASWTAAPVGMDYASAVARLTFAFEPLPAEPAFWRGSLSIGAEPTDTYLALCGWGKGQIWINDFHLGRYWASSGPQHTYYIPAALLRRGANTITLFENNAAPGNQSVVFVDNPDFTGAVCGLSDAVPPARAPAKRPAVAKYGADKYTAGCVASPVAGTNLVLEDCNGDPAAALWRFVPARGEAGVLQLDSNPSLCVAQVGLNPHTGEPNLALGACNVSDATQHLLPFPLTNSMLLNPLSGKCVDAEGGGAGAGARIELYSCDGGGNQAWLMRQQDDGLRLVGGGSGLCLTACDAALR